MVSHYKRNKQQVNQGLKMEMRGTRNRFEGNKAEIKKKLQASFKGMGKLKDFQLEKHIYTTVKIQPVRRIPFL